MSEAPRQIDQVALNDSILQAHMRNSIGSIAISCLAAVIAYFSLKNSLDSKLLNTWLFVGLAIIACRLVFYVSVARGPRAKEFITPA